jgi:O-acetyl-ADP-ribose deacetylase (regulator of RNase III)
MKKTEGNLIEKALNNEFDLIIHGCNCHCNMGGGIAKQIREIFPEAYDADLKTIEGDPFKLGTYSYAYRNEPYPLIIVNAYTQFHPGPDASYEAIEKAFVAIKKGFGNVPHKIGIPQIGCGIGGLEWDQVEKIIDKIFDTEDVTVVIYKP